mmetsp:Transcript_25077/g.59711  ORF Transcript_25077/g.59711 Transcript_25077/m.59711 type:complete len:429 (+) Transcript_25077:883-2169(+)
MSHRRLRRPTRPIPRKSPPTRSAAALQALRHGLPRQVSQQGRPAAAEVPPAGAPALLNRQHCRHLPSNIAEHLRRLSGHFARGHPAGSSQPLLPARSSSAQHSRRAPDSSGQHLPLLPSPASQPQALPKVSDHQCRPVEHAAQGHRSRPLRAEMAIPPYRQETPPWRRQSTRWRRAPRTNPRRTALPHPCRQIQPPSKGRWAEGVFRPFLPKCLDPRPILALQADSPAQPHEMGRSRRLSLLPWKSPARRCDEMARKARTRIFPYLPGAACPGPPVAVSRCRDACVPCVTPHRPHGPPAQRLKQSTHGCSLAAPSVSSEHPILHNAPTAEWRILPDPGIQPRGALRWMSSAQSRHQERTSLFRHPEHGAGAMPPPPRSLCRARNPQRAMSPRLRRAPPRSPSLLGRQGRQIHQILSRSPRVPSGLLPR